MNRLFQFAVSASVLQKGTSLFCAAPKLTSVNMSSSASTRYDLVIYGATGFTGQYVVEEVARVAEAERSKLGAKDATLHWAIAGRNKTKLLAAIEEAKKQTGLPLEGIGILEADLADLSSVDKMTAQAKVVINCVGPYVLYGEKVVKSCIENGADHVDISGEPQFLEGMQLKYDKAAEEKGVHIVGACGFDSIPVDMGIVVLGEQFPGGLNSVEMYCDVKSSTNAHTPVHTGTLESALTAMANSKATSEQRRKLFPTRMPKPKYKLAPRGVAHHNPEVNYYGVPFPSDVPVVQRSQRYRSDVQHLRPVQFQQYLVCGSRVAALGTAMAFVYIFIMAFFSWTRKLVLRFPEVLTGGSFSRVGAERDALKSLTFVTTLLGKGWSEELASAEDQHSAPPNMTKILKVRGPDPGYGATSLMMVASAMTLLREKEACQRRGGVMTPATSFAHTGLVKRLCDRGMQFEVQE